MFGVPRKLLAEFAPALRPGLANTGVLSGAVVVLPDQDKPSVGWFLRFVLTGGIDKHFQDVECMPVEMVVNRLRLVCHLGLTGGKLFDGLRSRLEALVAKGPVSMQDLARIYEDKKSQNVRNVADELTKFIVSEVLEGHMAHSIPGASACKPLYAVASTLLKSKQSQIRRLQRGNSTPLTVFQLAFIYQFSQPGEAIRKSVTRDLIELFDEGRAKGPRAYMQYGDLNADFEKDMQEAILQSAKRHEFLERKARREGKKVAEAGRAKAPAPKIPAAKTPRAEVPAAPAMKSGPKKDKAAAGKEGAKPKKVTFAAAAKQSGGTSTGKGAGKAKPAGKRPQNEKRGEAKRKAPVTYVERGVVLVLTSAGDLKRER